MSGTYSYFLQNGEPIHLTEDKDGCISGGTGSEPAWSFRLWNGAIALSQYIENIADEKIAQRQVIDLGNIVNISINYVDLTKCKGAGTGLVSLVIGKCGARQVLATDMPHAMALLHHNISLNYRPSTGDSSLYIAIKEGSMTCPIGHGLEGAVADCEEYMCNGCDLDIAQNDAMMRCTDCNFDICHDCVRKVECGDMSSLPTWYRVQLEELITSQHSQLPVSHSHLLSLPIRQVMAYPFDWADPSSLQELSAAMWPQAQPPPPPFATSTSTPPPSPLIIASDVTYNQIVVELFFQAVANVTRLFHNNVSDDRHDGNSSGRDYVELMFLHHSRELPTEKHMLRHLMDLMSLFPAPGSSNESRCGDASVQCQVVECMMQSDQGSSSGGGGGGGKFSEDGGESTERSLAARYQFSSPMSIAHSFADIIAMGQEGQGPDTTVFGMPSAITTSASTSASSAGAGVAVEDDAVDSRLSRGGKMRIFIVTLFKQN
jgi:predicted nicotinamide N-methyase